MASNIVKVKVDYPKDYKGNQFFTNGTEVEVSEELKAQFIEIGIVKDDKK